PTATSTPTPTLTSTPTFTPTPAVTSTPTLHATGTPTRTPTSTSTPTSSPTLSPTPTRTPGAADTEVAVAGEAPSPTSGRFTPQQLMVLRITEDRLEQREAAQPTAPVSPPIQLPLDVLDSVFNLIMSVIAAQPDNAQASPCQVGVEVANSVSPSEAPVGDSATFTFRVTNDGNIPLTDVEVDSDWAGRIPRPCGGP